MCNPHKPFMAEVSDIDPPIPADADLRSVRWFKLDIVSLLNSDFMQLANPEEFKAAFLLWTKSIHQVPAGSLPNDEAILAMLAGGYDHRRKPWQRIRQMALHGWDLCSDGRLYHQAVAGTVQDILSAVQVRAQVTDPLNAQEAAKAKGKARQQKFRDNQRAKRAMEKARTQQGDEPSPVTDMTTLTPVTLRVTPPVTPVTSPIKEEDREEDKEIHNDNAAVTLRVTPLSVTPETPLPDEEESSSPSREGALCKKLRALGVRAAPHMVVVQEMCARHADEHILDAAEIALEKKGAGIHVGYIAAMLKNGATEGKTKSRSTAGPPNRQLIPPVAVGGSHYVKL